MTKRDTGKKAIKWVGGILGLLTFAGLIAFAATSWWGLLAGAGIPVGTIIIVILLLQGWESVSKSGMTYVSATIVEQSLQPVTKAGFRLKEHDELPEGTTPASDPAFVKLCGKYKLDPFHVFDGIVVDPNWRYYYSGIDKVFLDVADEMELAEKIDGVDEVKIEGESTMFDVRKVKIALWVVRGAWEDRMRPRLLPDHGLFGFFDQRRMQVECTLILLKEVRPDVVIFQVEYTLQEAYDVSFEEKAIMDPDSTVLAITCSYNSHLAEAPAHAKAIIQSVTSERNWWMGQKIDVEDKLQKEREDHTGEEDDTSDQVKTVTVFKMSWKQAAGIFAAGALSAMGLFSLVLQALHLVT